MPVLQEQESATLIRGILEAYERYPYLNRLIAMLQSTSQKDARNLTRIFIVPLKTNLRLLVEAGQASGDSARY